LYGRSGKNSSFIEKLLFKDGQKTMTKRREAYQTAMDQYKRGVGNHTFKDGLFTPDVKSVKKNI
jgi:hypothetical protein